MAITLKDIQEKVFPTQPTDGYDVVQVDDFLDALTEQFSEMVRESIQLKEQIAKLESALNEATKAPQYNEDNYFKNLQISMRDTLISAQRVADETIDSAQAEADRIMADAQNEAGRTVAEAKAAAADMTERAQNAANAAKAEYDSLKAAADSFRAGFRKLVEDQLQVLKANDLLFK